MRGRAFPEAAPSLWNSLPRGACRAPFLISHNNYPFSSASQQLSRSPVPCIFTQRGWFQAVTSKFPVFWVTLGSSKAASVALQCFPTFSKGISPSFPCPAKGNGTCHPLSTFPQNHISLAESDISARKEMASRFDRQRDYNVSSVNDRPFELGHNAPLKLYFWNCPSSVPLSCWKSVRMELCQGLVWHSYLK